MRRIREAASDDAPAIGRVHVQSWLESYRGILPDAFMDRTSAFCGDNGTGTHLNRDMAGANRLGLVSVWLDWSPRRSKIPADAWEQPDYMIHTPGELVALVVRIEDEGMMWFLKCRLLGWCRV